MTQRGTRILSVQQGADTLLSTRSRQQRSDSRSGVMWSSRSQTDLGKDACSAKAQSWGLWLVASSCQALVFPCRGWGKMGL